MGNSIARNGLLSFKQIRLLGVMSNHVKKIILGAGLAGLSASYHGGGKVYDKNSIVGGACMSPKDNGYVFDHGIHVLHTKNEYVLNLLLNDFKIKFNEVERSSWIYSFEKASFPVSPDEVLQSYSPAAPCQEIM